MNYNIEPAFLNCGPGDCNPVNSCSPDCYPSC